MTKTGFHSAIIKFSYACYVFFILIQAKAVLSSLPDELNNRASGNVGFTTQDQQDPLSVPVPGDLPATSIQGPTNSFGNLAVNPSDLQSSSLSPNDNFDSTTSRVDDGGEDRAIWFDESTGGGEGTDNSIPSVPSQILDGVPEFINGIRQWFSKPEKPECKTNKHPICCQKGAPPIINGNPRSGGRRPSNPPKVLFEPLEYSQRRRVCRSCTQPNPRPQICHFSYLFTPQFSQWKDSMTMRKGLQSLLG